MAEANVQESIDQPNDGPSSQQEEMNANTVPQFPVEAEKLIGTSQEIKEFILSCPDDVLLEVYAHDCPSCAKMSIVMDQLATSLEGENIRVMKVLDEVAEDLYGEPIKATPIILYYPGTQAGKDKSPPISYEDFLEEQRTKNDPERPRYPVMSALGVMLFVHMSRREELNIEQVVDRVRDSDHIAIAQLSQTFSNALDKAFDGIDTSTPCLQEMRDLTTFSTISMYVTDRVNLYEVEERFFTCKEENPEAVQQILKKLMPSSADEEDPETSPTEDLADDSANFESSAQDVPVTSPTEDLADDSADFDANAQDVSVSSVSSSTPPRWGQFNFEDLPKKDQN
jgi:thiol-disulfide isomerase/thioredoxin